MAVNLVGVDRDTPDMFPPTVQEYLPEDHLARFVVEMVDQLDLSHLVGAYAGTGSRPYHPAMLVALLFCGYPTGVFSSRKLAQATHDSMAFRYLCANTHPDHRTIADFRQRFLDELAALFTQVLLIAQAMGLVKLGTVSLDGTKIKANASKHKVLSWEHANRLEEQLKGEVDELMRRAEQTYNAQAGVDPEMHLSVAQHVTDHTSDKQEVPPALEHLAALPAFFRRGPSPARRHRLSQRSESQSRRDRRHRPPHPRRAPAAQSALGRAVRRRPARPRRSDDAGRGHCVSVAQPRW